MPDDILDQTLQADSAASNTALPQALMGGVPAGTLDNWQARFTGLQRSVQEVLQTRGYQRFADIPAAQELATLRSQAQQAAAHAADFERVSAEHVALTQQHAALAEQLAQTIAKNLVFGVLAEVAPEIVPFAEYLPAAATREEVLGHIETFRRKLVQTGTTPAILPPPSSTVTGTGGASTRAVLTAAFEEARQKRNYAEMSRIQGEMLALPER